MAKAVRVLPVPETPLKIILLTAQKSMATDTTRMTGMQAFIRFASSV